MLFVEVEKCEPNPCYNNATCINDRIRFKCLCPNATEPETAIVGIRCNESKHFCDHKLRQCCLHVQVEIYKREYCQPVGPASLAFVNLWRKFFTDQMDLTISSGSENEIPFSHSHLGRVLLPAAVYIIIIMVYLFCQQKAGLVQYTIK